MSLKVILLLNIALQVLQAHFLPVLLPRGLGKGWFLIRRLSKKTHFLLLHGNLLKFLEFVVAHHFKSLRVSPGKIIIAM